MTAMTAAAIRQHLLKRWPADKCTSIYEAPVDAARQGRKIDALIVHNWRSQGHDLEAVEIKISVPDYRREIQDPSKADFWWKHTNRFWIAAPAPVAAKIRDDLPPTWGLLSIAANGATRAAITAPRTDAEPLPWPTMVGVLRAAQDAGVNALNRSYQQGFQAGHNKASTGNDGTHSGAVAEHLGNELRSLKRAVAAFEEASGVQIRHWSGEHQGQAFRMLQALIQNSANLTSTAAAANKQAINLATEIERLKGTS